MLLMIHIHFKTFYTSYLHSKSANNKYYYSLQLVYALDWSIAFR